jgi:hypothetical protein
MKTILKWFLFALSTPFMLLGMLMVIARAGFENGEELVCDFAKRYFK